MFPGKEILSKRPKNFLKRGGKEENKKRKVDLAKHITQWLSTREDCTLKRHLTMYADISGYIPHLSGQMISWNKVQVPLDRLLLLHHYLIMTLRSDPLSSNDILGYFFQINNRQHIKEFQ